MPTVTLLHLSDLHYSHEQSKNISIIRKALIDDLERLSQLSVIPDIVIFSGDLVYSGEDAENFANVKEEFLNPLLQKLNLGSDVVFITPGNHDISRRQVRSLKFVDDGLRANLLTVDSINRFIDESISYPDQNAVAFDRLAS